jgi:hypothetical protein
MGTTKLVLYNAALREIGQANLATLTDNVEARRVLDDVYADVLGLCLEEGQWNFAIRTLKIDSDPDVDLEFGWDYAFGKPTDWVRTTRISSDEDFSDSLKNYSDETDYWLANIDPIYVQFVSSEASFGGDLSRWPATYGRYVGLELAERISHRITTSNETKERIQLDKKVAKRSALNKDALNEAQPRYWPTGSWVSARAGWRSGRDRGSRKNLIG